MSKKITISTTINAPAEKVWEMWTQPEHIMGWMFASDDWECPYAKNDLRVNGKFVTRMATKDGSMSFDITGVYTEVEPLTKIVYVMDDGRTVDALFVTNGEGTTVTQTFEMEKENSEEMQRDGWQSILGNFKKYVEDN